MLLRSRQHPLGLAELIAKAKRWLFDRLGLGDGVCQHRHSILKLRRCVELRSGLAVELRFLKLREDLELHIGHWHRRWRRRRLVHLRLIVVHDRHFARCRHFARWGAGAGR